MLKCSNQNKDMGYSMLTTGTKAFAMTLLAA